MIAVLATTAVMVMVGCGSVGDSTSTGADASVTVADVERDLSEVFGERFGEARMVCGAWDWFSGGHAAGRLGEGNAMQCVYLNPADDSPLMVSAYVYLLDDHRYAYWITSQLTTDEIDDKPAPDEGRGIASTEFLYRDGLTCEQITAPVTVETTTLSTSRTETRGMDLGEAMYYWYDADRPAAMDPNGDGVPCDEQFDQGDIERLLESTRTIDDPSGSPGEPESLTVLRIRQELAAGGLPAGSVQVDCTLAGPVSEGSEFLCAPRENKAPEFSLVRVGSDGRWATEPTGDQSPTPVEPTVAALREHLNETLRSVLGDGMITCQGSGPIGQGSAIACDWSPIPDMDPAARSHRGPVFVAVLDDDGRYTFSSRIAGAFDAAEPSDYPDGTISCRTLKAPPTSNPEGGQPASYGLDYAALLYYWMAAGSPTTMDDDRDGLPCETAYPADTVQRVVSSPLSISPQAQPISREQVRAHAEAVLSGVYDPVVLQQPTPVLAELGGPCGGSEPIGTGDTLFCDDHQTEWGERQSGGVVLIALDDRGRYGIAHGTCCGAGPGPDDYPDDATCEELAVPPAGDDWFRTGLDYPLVVVEWLLRDRDSALDPDGNGIPCEQEFDRAEVRGLWDSSLAP